MLGQDDFVGQVVIDASWREGFQGAEVIAGARIGK
jgi:hypothetical protein